MPCYWFSPSERLQAALAQWLFLCPKCAERKEQFSHASHYYVVHYFSDLSAFRNTFFRTKKAGEILVVGRKRFVSNKQSITILREKSDGRALRQLQVGGRVQEAFITETRQAEQGFPAACRAWQSTFRAENEIYIPTFQVGWGRKALWLLTPRARGPSQTLCWGEESCVRGFTQGSLPRVPVPSQWLCFVGKSSLTSHLHPALGEAIPALCSLFACHRFP